MKSFNLVIIFPVILNLFTVLYAQNVSITLPLNRTITARNNLLHEEYISINASSTIQFNLQNYNKVISFVIFQAHSHLYNVTMYNNTYVKGSIIYGRNLGLYSAVKPMDVFYIYNANNMDIKLYVSVHGYRATDPIPGGMNLEFPVSISPFLNVRNREHYIFVEAAPPSPQNLDVSISFYRLYLPESNFDEDIYFDAIRNMSTIDKIEENGDFIVETYSVWPTRRMLSAYPGTGSIYAVVAYHSKNDTKIGQSVYVPTVSYGCVQEDENGCVMNDDTVSELISAFLFFVGLFVCYFGHRFFKLEMFLVGTLCGSIVTYIIVSLIANIDKPALYGVSVVSGLFFGAIWLVYWWLYGIPLIAVLPCNLFLGFMLSALIYYVLPNEKFLILTNDFNFWSLFILVMLLTSLALTCTTYLSNILFCAVIGAFAVIYPIDIYLGANMKYILVNVLRRAVVPMFDKAVIAPPYQWRDVLVTMIWIALSISGYLVQHYLSLGKPPFPPPIRSVQERPEAYGNVEHRSSWLFGFIPVRRPSSIGVSSSVPWQPLPQTYGVYTQTPDTPLLREHQGYRISSPMIASSRYQPSYAGVRVPSTVGPYVGYGAIPTAPSHV